MNPVPQGKLKADLKFSEVETSFVDVPDMILSHMAEIKI
jgi:hypothetical protein